MEVEAPVGYSVLDGPFADRDASLDRFPFLIRADLPFDRIADFVEGATAAACPERIFADFGCGRVRTGMRELSEEAWERLCGYAAKQGGHILLEKAPDEFRKRRDVYGPFQPAWKVMHRIKEAMDPKGIFAPGRLPGRK